MNFAKLISHLSTCARLQVGSVITNLELTVIYAIGFNGNAKGFPNRCDSSTQGLCGCVHSENNALIKCGTSNDQKILFVTTLPCAACAKLIINSGFKKVYYHRAYRDLTSLIYFKKAKIHAVRL